MLSSKRYPDLKSRSTHLHNAYASLPRVPCSFLMWGNKELKTSLVNVVYEQHGIQVCICLVHDRLIGCNNKGNQSISFEVRDTVDHIICAGKFV